MVGESDNHLKRSKSDVKLIPLFYLTFFTWYAAMLLYSIIDLFVFPLIPNPDSMGSVTLGSSFFWELIGGHCYYFDANNILGDLWQFALLAFTILNMIVYVHNTNLLKGSEIDEGKKSKTRIMGLSNMEYRSSIIFGTLLIILLFTQEIKPYFPDHVFTTFAMFFIRRFVFFILPILISMVWTSRLLSNPRYYHIFAIFGQSYYIYMFGRNILFDIMCA